MDFSVKRALEVAVIFACAIGVGSTAIIMTNNNDRTKSKNDGLWSLVDKNGSGSSDSGNNPTAGPNGEPLVSKTESQVGKYADIDGDGTVDGIIFADLMVGGSGEYGTNGNGTYTIPTISSSKDYYVSQESYTNALGGTAEVLTPTGSGADRFYIMALSDILYSTSWYNDAFYSEHGKISDYNNVATQNFGSGKSNTATMIEKWNAKAYGSQNSTDLWGQIQNEVQNGWFVPSSGEWTAFAKNLNLNQNYFGKGFSFYRYWLSSLSSPRDAYCFEFVDTCISSRTVNDFACVRFAAIF